MGSGALEARGEIEIVSLGRGSIQGMNLLYPGKKFHVDRTVFTGAVLKHAGGARPFLRYGVDRPGTGGAAA